MKLIFFSIIALFLSVDSFGQLETKKIDKFPHQLYFGKLSNNDFFKKADFIFEGKLISQKEIVNSDTTKVWTSSIFEVTHIFKGEGVIQKGLIELVRDCGAIYHDMNSSTPGMLIFDYNTEFCLDMGPKMVLFCTKSPISYEQTDNNFAVQPIENVKFAALYYAQNEYYPDLNFEVYGLKDMYFKTIEDFYNYAAKKKGITVPSSNEGKKKASLKNASVNEYRNPKLDAFMQKQFELVKIAKQNSENKSTLKSTAATNELTLSITNQKVTGSSTMYFEFDVYVNANNSNTYYSNAIARIDFNTSIFGYDLVANG